MTLAACQTVGATKPALAKPGPAADPIVETTTVTRLVCPEALYRALPADPTIPADAVIRHNDAGGDYLDAKIGQGQVAVGIVRDARAECAKQGAGKP